MLTAIPRDSRKVCHGKVYFSETFDDAWEQRWVLSKWKETEKDRKWSGGLFLVMFVAFGVSWKPWEAIILHFLVALSTVPLEVAVHRDDVIICVGHWRVLKGCLVTRNNRSTLVKLQKQWPLH